MHHKCHQLPTCLSLLSSLAAAFTSCARQGGRGMHASTSTDDAWFALQSADLNRAAATPAQQGSRAAGGTTSGGSGGTRGAWHVLQQTRGLRLLVAG